MTALYAIRGTIAPRSQPARMTVRGQTVQPTRAPIVLTPCRHCGELVCDCQDWLEWMLLTEPRECIGDE